jgi:hypothetical protein
MICSKLSSNLKIIKIAGLTKLDGIKILVKLRLSHWQEQFASTNAVAETNKLPGGDPGGVHT